MVITSQERVAALERQMSRLQRRIQLLDARSDRYSWIRLAIFFIGVALALIIAIFVSWQIGLIIGIIALIGFSIAVHFHRQIERSITRHTIWRYIKATQLARMQLDWAHIPLVPEKDVVGDHPFAMDLDITGSRSLHQLVNTAISREGTFRLQSWLLNTEPEKEVIQQRQTLIQEMLPLSRFRNKLLLKSLLASRNGAEQLEGKKLLAWLDTGTSTPPTSFAFLLIVSITFTILTLLLVILNLLGLITAQFWSISLLVTIGWFFARQKQLGDVLEDADFFQSAFSQLSIIFEYLESYPYGKNFHLKKLCEPFFSEREHSPSKLLKRLERLANTALLQKNQLFWVVINILVPLDIFTTLQLNEYKGEVASYLPVWLDVLFELEALSSLATFAYLHPNYVLPEVSDVLPQEVDALPEVAAAFLTSRLNPRVGADLSRPEQQDIFCAEGLGHPLIPEEQKVVNDFAISHVGEIIMITGSNMSGKSTFLRTLGINLCLAYAGGAVNATHLSTSLFRIYTCIKVSDSVNDGYSYFYAEVRRLRALLVELEESNSLPLFFLIDEIFKGTNNRERLIGSRAYIRSLVGKNCLGAISTHDLELVKLEETIPTLHNYHFREEVIDGQMVFDYILRPGPSPTTNALKIMQLEGLPVE